MCVLRAPSGDTMQNQYAPCEYVHTTVRRHYATVVDLRWCRSIHSCDSCTFLRQLAERFSACKPPAHPAQLCHAVHYGFCSAIKLTPKNGPGVATEPPAPAAQSDAQRNPEPTPKRAVQNVAQPAAQPALATVQNATKQNVQTSPAQVAVQQQPAQDDHKSKDLVVIQVIIVIRQVCVCVCVFVASVNLLEII